MNKHVLRRGYTYIYDQYARSAFIRSNPRRDVRDAADDPTYIRIWDKFEGVNAADVRIGQLRLVDAFRVRSISTDPDFLSLNRNESERYL